MRDYLKKLLAYKEDVLATVDNKLMLVTTQENVDAYVKKAAYSLRTETVMREAVFQVRKIMAQMKLE